MYFFGGSEGGREGLTMAQRFPADYDGIVSIVPVISSSNPLRSGVRRAAMRPIVLSDRQIAAVNTIHAPYEFTFSLANGVTAYPGFGYGGEDQPGGMVQWVSGARPAAFPASSGAAQGQQWNFGNGAVRYFIVRVPSFNALEYKPDAHADRVRYISGLMDSTNPDLSAFLARGGKLIMKENMADYAQSPFAGIAYYKSVVARMGQAVVDRFFRLYATPGVNHGGSGVSVTGTPVPQYVDLLGVLDAWVDHGQAPADALTQTARTTTAPFAVTASRPMCRYPRYPRYNGTGDRNDASSFSCVAD